MQSTVIVMQMNANLIFLLSNFDFVGLKYCNPEKHRIIVG